MSEENRPEYIGVESAPIPPWQTRINKPISEVESILRKMLSNSNCQAIVTRPLNKEIHFTITTSMIGASQSLVKATQFTLILAPSDNNTIVRLNQSPEDDWLYINFYNRLKFHINFTVDAPLLPKTGNLGLAETPSNPAKPPKETKPTAKQILAEYKKRRRSEPKLTLKDFCALIGANYDSVKAAKYRYSKPKKRGRKRLP